MESKASEEMVQIVDENNKSVRGELRWIMRKDKLMHRASFVFIYNSKKQIYVQMRTATKDYLPSHYSLCTGGVVQMDEPDLLNAQREVNEEMGIENPKLQYITTKFYKDDKVNVWENIYICPYDGEVKCQKEEVEYVELWDLDDVETKAKAGVKITPDSLDAFKIACDKIKSA